MSPYRDQDQVDIEGESRKLREELGRLRRDGLANHERMRMDVQFIRHALEPRPRWWNYRPSHPNVASACFIAAGVVMGASIIARAVCP